jgi:hypothetical protein
MDNDEDKVTAFLEEYIRWMHSDENILAEARERYAAGAGVRGLLRPNGAPEGAWFAVQRRILADGTQAAYLALRWQDGDRIKARYLGRLN